MKKLLIATANPGKFNEFQHILNEMLPALQLVSLTELNIRDKAEENGKTFAENAILKALFYQNLTELPALADDGGLEIDYLKGAPGVLSRRWPGHEATDEELVDLTLRKLEGVPLDKRGAQLRTVIAVAVSENKKVFTCEGVLRGYIADRIIAPIIPGFPFRSIFFLPEIGKVLAELSVEEGAKISHRRKALLAARRTLEKLLC